MGSPEKITENNDISTTLEIKKDSSLDNFKSVYQRRAEISAEIFSKETTPTRIKEIIISLADLVLNNKNIENEKIIYSEENYFPTVLYLFNNSILALSEYENNEGWLNEILKKYESFLFHDCNIRKSINNCSLLTYFQNENTDRILLQIAKKYENNIAKNRSLKNSDYFADTEYLYNLYKIVNDFSGKQPNFNFYLRYVQFSGDIFEFFSHAKVRNADLRIHSDRLNLALNQLRDQKNSADNDTASKIYCNFIHNLNPHTFDLNQIESHEKRGKEKIILEHIKCSSELNNLEKTLRDYVISNKEIAKNEIATFEKSNKEWKKNIYEMNYYSSLEYIKKFPNLLNNLDIKPIERADTAFYVIDQLFNEKFEQKIATEYWKTIEDIDEYELFQFIENYIRVRAAYTLRRTYEVYARILKTEYGKRKSKDSEDTSNGSLSSNFFVEVSDQTKAETANEWTALKRKISSLRIFLTATYHNKYKNVFDGNPLINEANAYNRISAEMIAMDEHFNYLVNLPMMLVMAYYTSKVRGGQIKIFYSGWEGTNSWWNIDTNSFFSNYFQNNRKTIPFFNYGTSRYDYNNFQIKFGFDFALRTGLFDLIPFDLSQDEKKLFENDNYSSNDKYFGLNNEYFFFKEYIRHLLNKHRIGIIKDIDNYNRIILQNINFRDRLKRVCLNPLQYHGKFSDINSLIYRTTPEDDILENGLNLIYNSPDSSISAQFDIDHIEELLKILKNYLLSNDADKRLSKEKFENRNKILNSIYEELNEYKSIIRKFRRMRKEGDDLVTKANSNCLARLRAAEILRQNYLLEKNVNFYKDIHAAMTLANLIPTSFSSDEKNILMNARAIQEYMNKKIAEEFPKIVSANNISDTIAYDIVERMRKIVSIVFSEGNWGDPVKNKLSLGDDSLENKIISLLNSFFMPHNTIFSSFPYDKNYFEWGFFIKEMENFFTADKKNFYYPKSKFNREELSEHARDALMRTWRLLNTGTVPNETVMNILANPSMAETNNSSYPIGNSYVMGFDTFEVLNNNSNFNESKFNSCLFQVNQRDFVVCAMTNYSGKALNGRQFIAWNTSEKNIGASTLDYRFSFIKNILDDRGYDISQENSGGCNINEWNDPIPFPANQKGCEIWKIDLSEFISTYLEKINFYNIDNNQRELFEWQNIEGKYSNLAKESFQFKDHTDTNDWTYFDEFYRQYFTTSKSINPLTHQLVILDKIEGSYNFEQYRDTRKTKIYSIAHLFPLNNFVEQEERNKARKKFINQINQINTAEAILEALENSKMKFNDLIFERVGSVITDTKLFQNRWRILEVKFRSSGERAGTPIYLSEDPKSAKNWFKQILEDFVVSETDCEIIPKIGDPDYEDLSNETKIKLHQNHHNCKEMARIWQDEFIVQKKKINSKDLELKIPNGLLQ